MSEGRMRRGDESLRHVLSEALLELQDPRIGFVTVTGVRTARDLSQARVFVSVLGSEKKQAASMAGLARREQPGCAGRGHRPRAAAAPGGARRRAAPPPPPPPPPPGGSAEAHS